MHTRNLYPDHSLDPISAERKFPCHCCTEYVYQIKEQSSDCRFIFVAYSKELIDKATEIAKEKGIKVQKGVYIGTQGPTFETPSEYKMFRILGADAVGMSTVPEVIVANHCGIKVFGMSVITDLGVEGKIVEVSHEEVQKAADEAQPRMTTIMKELINRS